MDVVVFESESKVGGRLGSYERSCIPFSAGASYFCAEGPHMKKFLKGLLEESAISQWMPRVGMVGKSAVTSGNSIDSLPPSSIAHMSHHVVFSHTVCCNAACTVMDAWPHARS